MSTVEPSARPRPDPTELASSRSAGTLARVVGYPVIYVVLIMLAGAAAFAYELRSDGIFACSAQGYTAERYLAYCNALAYGDYDHGALWFGFEDTVRESAAAAEVLFVGSSRMQFAFSTNETIDWFAKHDASHYLLGFSHSENVSFTKPLLEALSPRAKVYVINSDRFFDDRVTEPVEQIFYGENPESRYRRKRAWQYPHRILCTAIPRLCGNDLGFYRSREHGHWAFYGSEALTPSGTADAEPTGKEILQHYTALARDFVSRLPVPRDCVLLTVVPWAATPHAEAESIADALGLPLIAPRVEGLRTFDGSHLDGPSAERWSQRFFEIAGDSVDACLADAKLSSRP